MGKWPVCIKADRTPKFGTGNNRPKSPCEGSKSGGNNRNDNNNRGNKGGRG